jgi:2,4-dienoyl-CoA reductase (NADPH2)
MGCYELSRFDNNHDAMIESLMRVYARKPELRLPGEAPQQGAR